MLFRFGRNRDLILCAYLFTAREFWVHTTNHAVNRWVIGFTICRFALFSKVNSFVHSMRTIVNSCCNLSDEAPFLREWIEFHRIVGVDKFYFYSNDSKDKYKTVLKPYIASGVATLIEWPTTLSANGKQAQTQCLGSP
jgi:hypothetical protein